jgi:hypothetical protein
MKKARRILLWCVFGFLLIIFFPSYIEVVNYLLRDIESGLSKTILESNLYVLALLIPLWFNMMICEDYPRLSLFWSDFFCSKRAIRLKDSKDGEKYLVIGVNEGFLYVEGDNIGVTEKIFDFDKYFSNIEFGDVLKHLGKFLYHSGPAKETVIVEI